jgi:predicted nuclease of predicted toxin-antitoxin system
MAIRIYLDEDTMSRSLINALRARGVDVTAGSDVGMRSRSDAENLAYASAEGLVLFSFNTNHYMALHTSLLEQGQSHAGLILSGQHYKVGEMMRRILRIVAHLSAEEMKDRVEFLSSWGE